MAHLGYVQVVCEYEDDVGAQILDLGRGVVPGSRCQQRRTDEKCEDAVRAGAGSTHMHRAVTVRACHRGYWSSALAQSSAAQCCSARRPARNRLTARRLAGWPG